MSCNYDPNVHFKEDTRKKQVDMCVAKTMAKMSRPERCVKYMSSVLSTDENSQNCSISDIHGICSKYKSNFSVKDAKNLCERKNEAVSSFWSNKYSSQK